MERGIIHMEKWDNVFSVSEWKTKIVGYRTLIGNKFHKGS
jgi:hypothetical protein